MNFHPYAEIFPLIEGDDFDTLVADIKTHGLREKIWTFEGKILDGRNRFLACKKAKVKPEFREFHGEDADADAFVWSVNTARRHLSASQLAMAAAKRATLQKGANQHAHQCAPSQEEAAAIASVSRRSVQQARKVIDAGSKALQRAVETGQVSVKKAAAVVDLPKSEQLKAATKQPKPTAAPAPPDDADAPDLPEDIDEDAALAAAEADQARRLDAILKQDDKLAAAMAQIKQQSALIGTLEVTRDSYMRGKEEMTRLLKIEQGKCARLEREKNKLLAEIESLKERVAIMESA